MSSRDIIDMDGCIVRDERGRALAVLRDGGDCIVVKKMPGCTIGTYFYIMTFLKECGFDVK